MRVQPASGTSVMVFTFLVAGLLQLLPMPASLSVGRPLWIEMVLVFWILALPQRVGVFTGFVAGLLTDVLLGQVLGVYGIALALLAYLTLSSYTRLRVYGALQQSIAVFLLLGVGAFAVHIFKSSLGQNTLSPLATLLPVLVSAILWRPMLNILRVIQVRFMVR